MSARRLKPAVDRFRSPRTGLASEGAASRLSRMRRGCVSGSVRGLTVALIAGGLRVLKRDVGHEVENLALRFLWKGRNVPEGNLKPRVAGWCGPGLACTRQPPTGHLEWW